MAVPGIVSALRTAIVSSSETIGPACLRRPSTLARPKSRIFTWPRALTKRLAGLMSRWTIPLACADSSASAIWIPSSSSSGTSSVPAPIRWAKVCPSSSSMTMKFPPSCCSIANTVQMFGWLSAEAARASRWNRSSDCAS